MTARYEDLYEPAGMVFIGDIESESDDFRIDVSLVLLANFRVPYALQSPVDEFRRVGRIRTPKHVQCRRIPLGQQMLNQNSPLGAAANFLEEVVTHFRMAEFV